MTPERKAQQIVDAHCSPYYSHGDLKAAIAKAIREAAGRFEYAVYAGAEQFDYGGKPISALCQSEEQARHMARFWKGSGYYERNSGLREVLGEVLGEALRAKPERHRFRPYPENNQCSVCDHFEENSIHLKG